MAYVGILSNSEAYLLTGPRSAASYEPSLQSSPCLKQEGLEVTEAGKAVKVQTDKPHLVSLGSGRLSTSVTLHPLQEGLTRIGTADSPVSQDIIIVGTGVDREHCYIENHDGVVTLHPISERISVDGLRISTATRLTQGCMICLGRSNYFRFNHPQEAQMMKSIFPNSRISVVPINFIQDLPNMHNTDRSPLTSCPKSKMASAPEQTRIEQFRDELESEDFVEKVSKFEFLAHSKQNSSPSDPQWWFVKEGLRCPQHNTLPRSSSSSSHPRSSSSSSSAGTFSPPCSSHSGSKPASPPQLFLNLSTNVPSSLSPPRPSYMQTTAPRGYGGYEASKPSLPPPVPAKPGTVSSVKPPLPSPKLPSVSKIDPHISPKVFLPMASGHHGNAVEKPRHLSGRCTPTYHRQNGMGNHCSLEDLRQCERELQKKHQKVIEERMLEQELEKQEQQRLEEILNMCAEYERQVQREKTVVKGEMTLGGTGDKKDRPDSSTSSGTTSSPIPSPGHIIHMNRIKTNGSLPRERMAGCRSSPRESLSPASQPPRSFKSTSSEDELDCIFDFSSIPHSSVPAIRGRNKGGTDGTGSREALGGGNYMTYPQSPRTHIKTVVPKGNTISALGEAGGEIFENQLALTISDDQLISLEKNASARSSASSKSSMALSPSKQLHSDGCSPTHADTQHPNAVSQLEILIPLSSQVSPRCLTDELFSAASPFAKVEFKTIDIFGEKGGETLKSTRSNLMQRLSDLKSKILELESQEEEALNELDIECALLDAEYQDDQNNLLQQQALIRTLKQQEKNLADTSERDRTQEHGNIIAARNKVKELENSLLQLEKQVDEVREQGKEVGNLIERIQHQQEVLETERKNFEDLEFQLLEHDAHREEEKEQVIQEINKAMEICHSTQENLSGLTKQKNELISQVKKETGGAELERQMLLLQFKMEKQKLHAIESKMNVGVERRLTTKNRCGSSDASPRSSDGELQNKGLEEKLRQLGVIGRFSGDPEDLISRMTANVPVLPKEGIVSIRTTATLQEIERSRQKILEVQGVLVIEQERQRLEEIKRRVANEVCIQWQERKQREASSLPSSESERSSASSSDIPAESVTSDDAFGKFTDSERNSSSVSTGKDSDDPDKVQQREQKLLQASDDTRPLSGSSSQEDWTEVKLREKHRLQRPLTRYLPVRSENFDLKQHIETAGHQIEQCSQIQLSPTSCRGYLHKMGSKFKTWNKRWFVFDRSKRTLVYYADKHEHSKPRGVYFQAIEEVYVDHLHSVKSPNPKLTFCVKTLDRTYYLMAPNAEAMRIWVDVIFTGAEGYREFQLEV